MNWVARLPGALLFLARGTVTSVIGNLSLAVLALALALSLWVYVTDKENPTEQETFNSSIPVRFVNVPNDLAVANTSHATVSIRIEGTRNALEGLRRDDFEATVNLGGLERGGQNVAVDVSSPDRDVDVIGVTPSSIEVTLENLRTREVPVRIALVGSPLTGFAAASQQVQPERVTVSGPESLVALVDHVVAEVSLTGLRVDVTQDRVRLQPRDARGGEISRVSVSPETSSVTVDLEQREFSLEFAVTPPVTGQPASGYNLGAILVEPRVVVVTGPLDVLQSLDALRGLATEEVSVADASDDVTRTTQVVLPEGLRIDGSPTVRVTVDITPARGEFTYLVVPQVRNIGEGLAATPAEPIRVTLSGDVPVLQSLGPESIVAIADAQGLGPGFHALSLNITPPAGTTLVSADPQALGVAITQRT